MRRRLIVFTVPADHNYRTNLPPNAQHATILYDDTAGGLQAAPDFQRFAARLARVMFQDFDWETARAIETQKRLTAEDLARRQAIACLPLTEKGKTELARLAADIRQAVMAFH